MRTPEKNDAPRRTTPPSHSGRRRPPAMLILHNLSIRVGVDYNRNRL